LALIDPAKVCLFIPGNLKKFKLKLFEGIGKTIESYGGSVVRGDHLAVDRLPIDRIPIIGCSPQFRPMIPKWRESGRTFVTWDRGYLRRVFATWLPNGHDLGVPGGYYRWTVNDFQMRTIRDVPDDRWRALKLQDQVKPWRKDGRHIVAADTGFDYWDLHADRNWTARLVEQLKEYTDRPIIVRDKECKTPLYEHLKGAHALVTHGSIAAVESVVMGCPVFVHGDSAAALMGQTDFSQIETPVYPERQAWLCSLAYNQFCERELVDGTLWRLLQ
jgi:hypothetical protein